MWKELSDQCLEIKDSPSEQKTEEQVMLDFTKQINGKYSGAVPAVDICIAYSPLNGSKLARYSNSVFCSWNYNYNINCSGII